MGTLGFVNWRVVNERFCVLMWIAALVLACVILTHLAPSAGSAAHHAIASRAVHGVAVAN